MNIVFVPKPQCYEKCDFGSFQKGGHREGRTLYSLKVQVTRTYFTDIPSFLVPGLLGEIQTIKFWAFFEILNLIKKIDSDFVLYIKICNYKNQPLQK